MLAAGFAKFKFKGFLFILATFGNEPKKLKLVSTTMIF
jgi:hypothetical protein